MIELQHLTKRFATQGGTVVALNDINLTIQDGDIYGIIGMSGAGKSTLVRCINMLERPDEGKVIVNGREMMQLSPAELRDARREITMIFQQFNLLMQRTCLCNIMFPMELAKVPKEKAEARAREQARKEYENSALVQTIRKLVERNHGSWSGTAKEILEAGKLLTRRFIAESPQEVSNKLKNLESELLEFDGIEYNRIKRGNTGAKHHFQRNALQNESQLVQMQVA